MSKIVIVPKGFKQYLVKDYFNLEDRYLTVEDFYNLVLGDIDNNKIVKLLNFPYNYPYHLAKQYLKLSRFVEQDDQDELLHLLYTINDNQRMNIDQDIIMVNVNDRFISKHYNVEKRVYQDNNVLHLYRNKDEELRDVFNKIGELLEQGVSAQAISIIVCDDTYMPLINYLSLVNNLELSTNYHKTLASNKEINDFITCYNNGFDNALESINNQDVRNAIINIKNKFNQLSDEQFKKVLIKEAQTTSYLKHKIINTIEVSNINNMKVNKYNFVVGVSRETFPDLKDDFILDDQRCQSININDSKVRQENKQLTQQLLLSLENTYVSGSNGEVDNEEFTKWVSKYFSDYQVIDEVIIGKYINDIKINKKQKQDDYQFSNVEVGQYQFDVNENIPISKEVDLSYTSLDAYAKCRYRFFLQKIVGLKKYKHDTTTRGKVIHGILEQAFSKREYVDEEKLEQYANECLDKEKLEGIDRQLALKIIRHYYYYLDEFITFMLNEYQSKDVIFHAEKELDYQIDDQFIFKGTVDLIIDDKEEGLSVIDFKNKENVDVSDYYFKDKINIQNFWYLFLIKKHPEEFKQLLFNETKQIAIRFDYVEAKHKKNEFELKTRESAGHDGRFAQSLMGINAQKEVDQISEETIDKYLEDLELYLETVTKDIANGDFSIKPVYGKKKVAGQEVDGCSYCQYKDICHVPRNYKKYIEGKDERN